jgi:hypothetical protein
MVINLRVPHEVANLLTRWAAISFSRRILPHSHSIDIRLINNSVSRSSIYFRKFVYARQCIICVFVSNSMQLSPSWEATICSATQEFPYVLRSRSLPCSQEPATGHCLASYESPHYAIFSNFPLFNPSLVEILSSATCSQISSIHILPLWSETKFHTHAKLEPNL